MKYPSPGLYLLCDLGQMVSRPDLLVDDTGLILTAAMLHAS